MTLQENIAKFSKIVRANSDKVQEKSVVEVARAIVLADVRHIGDEDRGKYEHLTLSALASAGVVEFNGVCAGCNHSHGTLSDVMVVRIMCDVLTLLLNGDQPFAMRYSADVAKALKQRERTKAVDYLEMDMCEKILDRYASTASYDASLKPVFEKTAFYLAEMKRLQPRLDRDCIAINKTCMRSAWLPSEFDSSGFDVSTQVPKVLDGVPGDIVTIVTCYNLGYVLDVLIKAIVRDGNGDVAQWSFLNRLHDISSKSQSAFPVGTGVVPGIRGDVYVPYHFLDNQALRVTYEKHFTKDVQITQSGVDGLLQAIKVWLRVA